MPYTLCLHNRVIGNCDICSVHAVVVSPLNYILREYCVCECKVCIRFGVQRVDSRGRRMVKGQLVHMLILRKTSISCKLDSSHAPLTLQLFQGIPPLPPRCSIPQFPFHSTRFHLNPPVPPHLPSFILIFRIRLTLLSASSFVQATEFFLS